MEWLCNSVLVTEQIKEKEARKDILNRPVPASCDLPLARVRGVETRGTGMTFQGFVHGSQQRLCSWTWRAAEAEYDWSSFIIPLLSLTPPTPTHTHIKEKEQRYLQPCEAKGAAPAFSKELELCPGLRNHLGWWSASRQPHAPGWHSLKGHLRTSDQKEHLWAAGCSKQKHRRQLNRGRLLGEGKWNLFIPVPSSSFVEM